MTTAATDTVAFMSREEVERPAVDVLRSHSLETVLVDPVMLANRLGISVPDAKFSDDNLVGMIAKRGGTVTMLVNVANPPFRKRFTIATNLDTTSSICWKMKITWITK